MAEITKATAVGLFTSMKLREADKWPTTKLQKMVNDLKGLAKAKIETITQQISDKAYRKVLTEVWASLQKGERVNVVEGAAATTTKKGSKKPEPVGAPVAEEETFALDGDEGEEAEEEEEEEVDEEEGDEGEEIEVEDEEGEGEDEEALEEELGETLDEESITQEEPMKTATAKKPAAPKEEKPAKAPRQPADLDRFGMRKTDRILKINGAINGTPKTIKEIQTDAGYDKSINNHIRKLLEQGHIAKTEDGKYYDPKMSGGQPRPAPKPAAEPAPAKPAPAKPAAKPAANSAPAKAGGKPAAKPARK